MPVVYDGVEGDPRGDLFQGLKLWISHRVPLRSRWVDLVKGNGGEVVPLETKADMKIADNVKRGGFVPPPGSYSYQWIEFSVKNGQLENRDDYEIGPPQGTSRQIGSAQQTRSTRTAFTVKDDLILTKWVLARQWKGQATQGNEMYKELEHQHPHHTWQSWRDRWVKTIKNRPQPNISPESLGLNLEPEQNTGDVTRSARGIASSSNQATTSHNVSEPQVRPPKADPSNSEHSGGHKSIQPSEIQPPLKKRRFFSEEEDQMLISYVQEARDRGDMISGNVLYQQFAEEHPSRTWQSWRDRWVRHLRFKDTNLDDQRQTSASNLAQAEHNSSPSKSTIGHSSGRHSNNVSLDTTKSAREGLSSEQRPNPRSDDERLKRQVEMRRRVRAVKTLQRTWRGHSVRRDLATLEAAVVPLQSMIRGYLARQNPIDMRTWGNKTEQSKVDGDLIEYSLKHEDGPLGSQDGRLSSTGSMPHAQRELMNQFYSDLDAYIEVSGDDVDPEPTIRGRRIDLWDLYRIATKQDCQPEHRDMRLVADELGLEWKTFPDVLNKLQQCYHQNLADFENAINSYNNEQLENDVVSDGAEQSDDIEDEDIPQTSDAVTAPKEPLVAHSSADYRSSPPVVGFKRTYPYEEVLTSDPGYPSAGSRKRRCLDKNSVIPPTPEGKLGYSKDQSQHNSFQDFTSPLKSRGNISALPIDISSDDEDEMIIDEELEKGEQVGQDELPSHSKRPKQKHLEPETQDWSFAPMPHDGSQKSGIYESIEVDEISPSQQLQIEDHKYHSPDRHAPTKGIANKPAEGLSDPASPAQKNSEHTAAGPRRSTRQRIAAQQSPTTTSRFVIETRTQKRALPTISPQAKASTAVIRGTAPLPDAPVTQKAKKRILPPARQQYTTPKASMQEAARPSYSTPTLQRRPQSQMPTSVKASANGSVLAPKSAQRLNGSMPGPATRATPSVRSSPKLDKVTFDDEYVDAQVEHFEALGYDRGHILTAMWAATFQRGPQTVALESLNKGLGLPQNEPGIWTEQDVTDLAAIRRYEQGMLTGMDKNQVKVKIWHLRNRLMAKHGEKGLQRRQEMEALTSHGSKGKGKAHAA